jgi:hypothetical protein
MSVHASGRQNRLAAESSPYLLLHASNPVDWHPWGREAFEKARREDKPIFLSVGYSTCYWCHVMERQCFSDPEIARQLNDGFVSVKLDREERPDLDEIYMTATQLLTRSGGWPNSLFLTHDLKPFFAGTYFPPTDEHGRPGFPRVLASLGESWRTRRDSVIEQAEAVAQAIREQMGASAAPSGPLPGAGVVASAQSLLARRFDPEWGGFGGAPKFPSPSNLCFLLDRARGADAEAEKMLVATLAGMARGGIHDQVGGGFHRYSTDAEWLVPHFEKMLYDNATLGVLYAEAASRAPGAGFERVAATTLDFVLAELTAPEGGFLSAIDAETDGDEGAYYTWTRDELKTILGGERDALLAPVFGFDGRPNFEAGRFVLHLPEDLAAPARRMGVSVEELLRRIEPGRAALLEARWERKRPLVDDKVLTDWNGLMIGAMARAGELLAAPRYGDAAARAANFVLGHLGEPGSGLLLHTYRGGAAKFPAMLDDYAFLVAGLLELHAASREERWLAEARRLTAEQDLRLWDRDGGGYFAAGEDPDLLLRSKAAHDGAVASGNGVAALNLIELGIRTGDPAYREHAEQLLRACGAAIAEWPLAHVTLVRALARLGRFEERSPRPRSVDAAAEAVVTARGTLGALAEGAWRRFVLELSIREGWHVNAHPASLPSLVATAVDPGRGQLRGVRYPPGEPLRSELSSDSIAVYTGEVEVEGEVEMGDGAPSVRLTYQPCDEARCLPPVTLEIPLAPSGSGL